jgi:hypothetical protein
MPLIGAPEQARDAVVRMSHVRVAHETDVATLCAAHYIYLALSPHLALVGLPVQTCTAH